MQKFEALLYSASMAGKSLILFSQSIGPILSHFLYKKNVLVVFIGSLLHGCGLVCQFDHHYHHMSSFIQALPKYSFSSFLKNTLPPLFVHLLWLETNLYFVDGSTTLVNFIDWVGSRGVRGCILYMLYSFCGG